MQTTLQDLAVLVNGTFEGHGSLIIKTLSAIDDIKPNSIVFADSEAHLTTALNADVSAIIINNNMPTPAKPCIKVANPHQAFITLLQHFYPEIPAKSGIHETAIIEENVSIGKNVSIGPYVVIGSGSQIGDNCVIKSHVTLGQNVTLGASCTLHPKVTVYNHSKLGNNVIIHSGTVIGSDGFGYKFIDGQQIKVPHVGHVIIHDNVEIGANTTIDRATLGATVIGEGTKIDNLVQVAHSVKLGKNNILCAFTGIAGSSTSGDNVVFAANVGVSDHVTIEDGVILGARAGVPSKKTLRAGLVYLGSPARPRDKAIEQELASGRVPMMSKKLKALSEKVTELSKKMDAQGE